MDFLFELCQSVQLWITTTSFLITRPQSFNSCSAVDGAIILIHDPDSKKKRLNTAPNTHPW
jgi:hypothetical protein